MENRNVPIFGDMKRAWSHADVLRFYSLKTLEEFQGEERELADRYVSPGHSVLLVGGGGVRDAAAWAQRGNPVTVTDLSEPMVQLARNHLGGERAQDQFAVANAVALPFRAGSFDHLVFCDGVYCHIPGRALRIRTLRDAARLLKRGCMIVYANWLRPSRASVLPRSFQRLRVWKQWLLGNFSEREPGDAVLRRLVPDARLSRPCFFHYFQDPDEIERELRESGLTLVDQLRGIWILKS
jgi:ubiquinone/menaquinone biosynthesis C-methylase UbiE